MCLVLCVGEINRELMAAHVFTVTARYGDSTTNTMYEIRILDENDHTPTFLDATRHHLTLPEDVPVRGGRGRGMGVVQ